MMSYLMNRAEQFRVRGGIFQYIYTVLIAVIIAHSPSHAADLMTVYSAALEHDAQYAAARFANKAAQEKIPQGLSTLLPTFTLSGLRRRQYINTSVSAENAIDNASLNIVATQPIFRKENFVIYEQSKIQVMQADAQFIIASQDLILRVAQAYFDVLAAQVNAEVATTQKKAINEQLKQAKRNFEVGTSTIIDATEAQARFDLTTSQEIAAENMLEIRKRTLQQIIGYFPDNLARENEIISDALTLKYTSMDDWLTVAEQNSLTVKVQQAIYNIAKQEVERAKAGHYPTLDLVALYSNQKNVGAAITGRGIDLTSKEIGLQLNIPLFAGFSVQSRVREALANQEKVFQDMNTVKRNSVLQVTQQYLNVTNGMAQVKALKQALLSSQRQVESTKLGQEIGVRTEVDVLNAQQLLYSARRDLAQARYSFLMARLRLQAEAGELDEEVIKQLNEILQ